MGRTMRVFLTLAIIAIAFTAVPNVRSGPARAQTTGKFSQTVTYICAPATSCSNVSLVGLEIDGVNNVIYAINDETDGQSSLVRIDGNTDTYLDSFVLTGCNDARRPAIAHVNGGVKIYVACEDNGTESTGGFMRVLQASGGRLSPVTDTGKIIPLVINGIIFEPKTQRMNDALGLDYVVGDNLQFNRPCTDPTFSDPAFAINVNTDTIVSTNVSLETPGTMGTGYCGHQGIADVAIRSDNKVLFVNEDDRRLYLTDQNLTLLTQSDPVPDVCAVPPADKFPGDPPITLEDAPSKVAVLSDNSVLASAVESMAPCAMYDAMNNETQPGTGGLYSFSGTALTNSTSTPGSDIQHTFEDGAVASLGTDFLVAGREPGSGTPNCGIDCVQERNPDGSLVQSYPIPCGQSDVVFNSSSGKAYLSLDNGCADPSGNPASLAILSPPAVLPTNTPTTTSTPVPPTATSTSTPLPTATNTPVPAKKCKKNETKKKGKCVCKKGFHKVKGKCVKRRKSQ